MISRFFKPHTKPDTQKIFRHCIKLLPALARRGVFPQDALAIAFNAVYLFYHMPHKGFMLSPKAVLKRYSYAEIASLCENMHGMANVAVENLAVTEFGFNENFKEVLP